MKFLAVRPSTSSLDKPSFSWLAKARGYISILAILLTGPLLIHLPLVELFLKEFATRFGIFLIILVLWEILLRFITEFIIAPPKARSKINKIFSYIFTTMLSLGIFYWAGHLETKVTEEFFLGLVALLGIRGLSQGLSIAGYRDLSFATMMLYLFGISNFSGALTAAGWQWPFLVIALSIQSGLYAQFFIEKIKFEENLLSKNIIVFSRLHAASLSLGPILVSLLQYGEFLPKSYLLCLLSLALMLRSVEYSRKLEKRLCQDEIEALVCRHEMEKFSCYSTIVFLICISLAAFIEF